jgi:hypothetical protein
LSEKIAKYSTEITKMKNDLPEGRMFKEYRPHYPSLKAAIVAYMDDLFKKIFWRYQIVTQQKEIEGQILLAS